ncbi:ankyrin repeat domain-containing protein 10-like isoform X2 [Cebidichthys violaceus]|uniref:ankyrin repeat domain-containing protein 10-like isoform X2 n=1 Tax=Cebidichthys violaceus TaxID=271503 RepID=UPI0035CB6551
MSQGPGLDVSTEELFINRFPVHRACRDGDVGALGSLIQQLSNRSHLTAEDSSYGWTPLHWAAHYGQLECVVRLVQMGCEVNTVTSRFNQTPAHTAAFGGHPHCVVWLTQAGADVNSQDVVGEAPLHKAARSGSLECVQVLLLAGANPHLRNASGQTAADLALLHGFLDCFSFISKTKKHLLNGTRKRLLTAEQLGHMKRARGADGVWEQSGGEDLESMTVESPQEHNSAKAVPVDLRHTLPHDDQEDPDSPNSLSGSSPPANGQAAAAPARRSSADSCGSLHLTGSPSSCVSHRPVWRGPTGADCRDFLHYGHYHGFGDTAEELSDYGGGIHEHRHKQAVAGSVHLYQDS